MRLQPVRLSMVGTFPPPVHGMASVNLAMLAALRREGLAPVIVNTAAPVLRRTVLARLRRLPRVAAGLVRLARAHTQSLYISVSGGYGQVYECAFCLEARLQGARIFLHHNSFAYLDRRRWLTSLLFWIVGRDAVHIVLSPLMAARLTSLYGVGQVRQVSNSAVVGGTTSPQVRTKPLLHTLGFIGNIAPPKGIYEFLDLMEALRDQGSTLVAKVAGPFQDTTIERAVMARVASLPGVQYVGPKYGVERETYYGDVDALMFPSQYENEAEPLVVLEAMAHGIPVVAFGRGAIPEILSPDSGLVVSPSAPFVSAALAQIMEWQCNPAVFAAASRMASARFSRILADSEARLHRLVAEMMETT